MSKILNFNRIGNIDKTKLKDVHKGMIPDIISQDNIYHYTSINGLKDILKEGKLWFTHMNYMNDRDEIIAGIEQLNKVGIENYGEEYADVINAEAADLKGQDHKTYVSCFSLKSDILSMWNYYTKDVHNQGYSIGFNYKNLIVSLLQQNEELHGCNLSFGKIDYCISDENYASRALTQSIYAMSTALETLRAFIAKETPDFSKLKTSEPIPYAKFFGNEPIFRQSPSLDILYFMKRPCFYTEEEFRIVIQVPDSVLKSLEENKKFKYRISNGVLIPYLELDFDTSSLVGITLSPTINSDLAEQSIRDYCKYCNIDSDTFPEKIAKSEIPVRF